MNTQAWIQHFQTNAAVHDQIRFEDEPCTLPDPVRKAVAHSLAVFQLGESGSGSRLRRYAREVAPLENFRGYQRAIDLFICEEQAHSRLLARLVQHLGGTLLEKQWTNSVFRRFRFLVNLEFAIQVLLTAELIAEVYYGTLYLRAPDAGVQAACRQILRDEMRHLEFQRQFLAERVVTFGPVGRYLWQAQFRVVHAITSRVVAWDHRHCLKAIGTSMGAFAERCDAARKRFDQRLVRGVQELEAKVGTKEAVAAGQHRSV